MRFPIDLPIMSRLKKLFDQDNIKSKIELIPYIFESDEAYLHYNGVGVRRKDLPKPLGDVFHYNQVGVSPTNPDYFNPCAGYANICEDVIKPYVVALTKDLLHHTNTGWEKLMEKDKYSTRSYMSLGYAPSKGLIIGTGIGLDDDVITWELLDWV